MSKGGIKCFKVLVAAISLLLVSPMVAAGPTSFFSSWYGSGSFDGTFTSDDDLYAEVHTAGTFISGTWEGTDLDDDPYHYGIDTSYTQLVAEFAGGGLISFKTERRDSHVSMYGNPGQWMSSEVWSADGSSEMAKFEWVNFAELKSCNYKKPRTSGGHHFEANGSQYRIYTELGNGAGEGAYVELLGYEGSAYLDLMNSGVWGDRSYKIGRGCGCDTDADWQFTDTAAFLFERSSWADNSVTVYNYGITIPGGGPTNQAFYFEQIGGAGTFGDNDMSMSGN